MCTGEMHGDLTGARFDPIRMYSVVRQKEIHVDFYTRADVDFAIYSRAKKISLCQRNPLSLTVPRGIYIPINDILRNKIIIHLSRGLVASIKAVKSLLIRGASWE